MARQGMKKEGAVGLILIAIIIVVAVLAFRPKGLEAALGGGFDTAEVTKVTITLTPTAGGEALTAEVPAESEDFAHLLTVIREPNYSRTNTKDDQVAFDYLVDLDFFNEAGETWTLHLQGGRLVQAGPSGKLKTYQISGGQATQQKILDYCLTLMEED